MKKALCLLIALLTVITCFCACKKNGGEGSEYVFVMPDDYIAIINIKAGAELNVYMNRECAVVAVEAVDENARTFANKISLSGGDVQIVVSDILNTAFDKKFLTADSEISATMSKGYKSDLNVEDILSKVKTSAESALKGKGLSNKVKTSQGELMIIEDLIDRNACPYCGSTSGCSCVAMPTDNN